MKILDFGCGYGYWLRYLVELGAKPENMVGIDLSAQRIEVAKLKNPSISWFVLDSIKLPFPDESFDFIMQILVFSSIPDEQMRSLCASEIYRVTRKGGFIFWVDIIRTKSDRLCSFKKFEVQNFFQQSEIIYERCLHPVYFRRLYGKMAWLAKTLYSFTECGCESQLLVLRKNNQL